MMVVVCKFNLSEDKSFVRPVSNEIIHIHETWIIEELETFSGASLTPVCLLLRVRLWFSGLQVSIKRW